MFKKKFITFFVSVTLTLIVFIPSGFVLADPDPAPDPAPAPKTLQGSTDRLKTIGNTVYGGEDKAQPIEKVVGGIIQTGLTLIGVIFLVLTVYGGYVWMAARGDEAEAKRAKGIITMAVIGMLVVVGAYAITAFVVGRLLVAGGLPT